jgi:hypothetical protein
MTTTLEFIICAGMLVAVPAGCLIARVSVEYWKGKRGGWL